MWIPQPKQRLALMSPATELLYGGAAGGGKSDCLLGGFLQDLDWGKNYKGVIFRRSYPQLEELIERGREIYEPMNASYNKKESTFYFPNGAALKMRFLESNSDVLNYQGHQYQYIAFDELTTWPTDYEYTYMFMRLRSAHGVPCRMRAAANPGGPGHGWVKQRFIDVAPPMTMISEEIEGQVITRVYIPSTIEDNKILLDHDPGYLARLKQNSPQMYQAMRYGVWDIVDGAMFAEFDRRKHVIKPRRIPREWRRFCAMDWGYAKPFSIGWYAIDEVGSLIKYREYYGCTEKANTGLRLDAHEVAREAARLSMNEDVMMMVADPACWTKTGQGESVADSFRKAGFQMVKAVNDRKNGCQAIHNRLSATEEGLYFFETCVHTIRTLPAVQISKLDPEDVDTDSEDHAYDETRYAVMSRYAKMKPTRAYEKKKYDPLNYRG